MELGHERRGTLEPSCAKAAPLVPKALPLGGSSGGDTGHSCGTGNHSTSQVMVNDGRLGSERYGGARSQSRVSPLPAPGNESQESALHR